MIKRIINPEISIVGGVAAGIAYRFGISALAIRLVFALTTIFFFPFPVIIYGLLWWLAPKQYISKTDYVIKTENNNEIKSPYTNKNSKVTDVEIKDIKEKNDI